MTVTVDFGDDDPEDGYDADDPPAARFAVIRLWVASIALEAAHPDHDHERVYERIQAARWAAGQLNVVTLPVRSSKALGVLEEWLDELLEVEEG